MSLNLTSSIFKTYTAAYAAVPISTIPGQSMFIYKYFADDLLSLAQKELSIALTKRILKDTARTYRVI
jgi:hypothetical protein